MLDFENKDIHIWFRDALGKQNKKEGTRKESEDMKMFPALSLMLIILALYNLAVWFPRC